ncbi:MAG: hypothetical protein VKJ24_11600 [Synechococcales bacterium]|nr:hypothetical protein [Synechococcales bacterium]
MFNAPERLLSSTSFAPTSANSPAAIGLGAWFHRALNLPQGRVHAKLRGNHLYLLCEAPLCPDRPQVLQRLHQALADPRVKALLQHSVNPIYRLIVYGRSVGEARPTWAETIELSFESAIGLRSVEPSLVEPRHDALTPNASQAVPLKAEPKAEPLASRELASRELATGQPGEQLEEPALIPQKPSEATPSSLTPPPISASTAISALIKDSSLNVALNAVAAPLTAIDSASQSSSSLGLKVDQRLSQVLSQYGVSVRSKLKLLSNEKSPIPSATPRYRLWVLCEAPYNLDAELVAEAIAQQLRHLALPQVQDAIVSSQVQGEAQPDWVLRVDLTPAEKLLETWATWGDSQAIARLLNHSLRDQQVRVRVSSEGSTLHVHCLGREKVPNQLEVVERITERLTAIAPQGCHGASLYGLAPQTHNQAPEWLHWIPLPAAEALALADSTEGKAQQGDWGAIAHLLTRRLNPDLDRFLKTGGTKIQVRQRESVLHIMVDAPTCPSQRATVAEVTQVLRVLAIDGVTGICLYGRRAGQAKPLWKSGVDLATPKAKLVPQAVPEFAATDAYVGDLIAPAGALVWVPRSEKRDWRKWLEAVTHTTQAGLLRSHLFTPLHQTQPLQRSEPDHSESAHSAPSHLDGRVAAVWAAVGICFAISVDWGLGAIGRYQSPAPGMQSTAVTQTVELPDMQLNKSRNASDASTVFNSSGFTQGNQGTEIVSNPQQDGVNPGEFNPNLVAAVLQPKAVLEDAKLPYDDLNVEQLEERLALYQQVVQRSGVPDVLVIGSSRALRGIDPAALQEALAQEGYRNVRVFNFGINGATAQLVDLVLRRMIPTDQLPKLIIWADGARAFNSGRVDVTFNAIVSSPGYRTIPTIAKTSTPPSSSAKQPQPDPVAIRPLNERLKEAYEQLEQQLTQGISQFSAAYPERKTLGIQLRDRLFGAAPSPAALNPADTVGIIPEGGKGLIDVNGFLPLSVRFNPVTYYQKYSRVAGAFDGDYESFKLSGQQQDALRSLTSYLNQYKVNLVFVNLPLTAEYLDNTRRQYEATFQQHMLQTATTQKFTFRNLAEVMKNQNDFFSDPSHLNRYGAYAVAQKLAQDARIPWKANSQAQPNPPQSVKDAIVQQPNAAALMNR